MSDRVNEEFVATVDADKVPFKNTAVGRAVRTFYQCAAAVITVLAASAEFRQFILDNFPQIAVLLPVLAALASAIQNLLDPNVKNL